MFQIEKNIPIPTSDFGKGRPRIYPLGDMDVGDSFFTTSARNKVASAVSYYGLRNGKKFAVRTVDGGVRVWRVA